MVDRNRVKFRRQRIAELLASPGLWTVQDLAAELGVNPRTVFRDIAWLRDEGYPVEGEPGRGGGLRMSRHWRAVPISLRAEEAIALVVSAELARAVGGLPFSRSARLALSRVLAQLPNRRRREIQIFCRRIVVGPPASSHITSGATETETKMLDVVEAAFSEQKALAFSYTDAQGRRTKRKAEPHGLLVQMPVWYVLARDIQKKALRMFRMDRMHNARIIESHPFTHQPWVVEEMAGFLRHPQERKK
jgi:predicted DNA-binding transcriptional regulator YafY